MKNIHKKWHNVWIVALLMLNTMMTPLAVLAQENETNAETTLVAPPAEEVPTNEIVSSEESSLEEEEETLELESSSLEESIESKEDEMNLSVNGPPKVLTEVFQDVVFFSPDLQEMKNNPLVFVKNAKYSLRVIFNLAKYNNNLNNGDSFTLNLPAPMTVTPKSVEFVDSVTKVAIGDVSILSSGPSAGGTATVTLKNLDKYLDAKGDSEIVNVSGFFTFEFKFENETKQVLPLDGLVQRQSVNIEVITPKPQPLPINGEVLYKQGGTLTNRVWNSPSINKSGTKLHPWGLILNRAEQEFGTLTVVDEMSLEGSPFQFIPEQFKVYEVRYNEGNRVYTRLRQLNTGDHVVFSNNYTKFELTIANAGRKQYVLEYSTTAPENNTNITNVAYIMNDGVELKPYDNAKSNYEVKWAYSQQSEGSLIESANRIIIFKVDEDDKTVPVKGAKFLVTSTKGYRKEFISDERGRVYVDQTPLEAGDYTITEIEAPPGYELNPTPMVVKVGRSGVIRTWPNKKIPTTSFTVTKNWVNGDPNNRPAVQFQLKRDGNNYGEVKTLEANSPNGSTVTWESIPKYQDGTQTLSVYTVEELPLENYTSEVDKITDTTATVTNTYTNNETISLTGKKVWKDYNNKFNTRPDKISVTILQNNQEFGKTVEVSGDANAAEWAFTVENLPKYNSDAQPFVYTLKEATVAGYATEYGVDNVITNTYVNKEKINFTVTKQWDDYNNKFNTRPTEVIFNLKLDGIVIQNPSTTEAEGWRFEFTNLDKYDSETGELNEYTVEEVPIAGYETPIVTGDVATGFTVTNKYINTDKLTLTGKKIWNDYNNKFNTRPSEVTVTVLQNGEEFNKTIQVTGEMTTNEWAFTVEDLPKYDATGEPYTYTLKEETVAGYTTEYGANNTITNTYVNTEKLVLTGKKIWNDYNNKFNTRPSEVMVTVLQNGEEFNKTIQVTGEMTTNEWAFTVEDLPKYDASGEPYTYTLKEETVAGYTTEYGANNTITNTYVNTEKLVLTGKKIWNDYNNKFNTRPSEVTMTVLQNGEEFNKTIQVAGEMTTNEWAFTVEDLPKYDASGEPYTYTLKEETVAGYTTEYGANNTITNTYVNTEKLVLTGKKIWNDYNNKFNTRPSEVMVTVLQNGEEFNKTIQVAGEMTTNEWAFTVEDLPKYDASGEPYTYTLKEETVAGYTTEYGANNTITNTYVNTEKLVLTGKKIWNDYNNKFNTRPSEVTMTVLQNGEEFNKTIQVTGEMTTNEWAFTVEDLPKYDASGEPYTYTLKEEMVAGYTTEYDANNTITNTYVNTEKLVLTGKKIWNDYNNKFNTRPSEVTMTVLQNGEEFNKTIQVAGEMTTNEWAFTVEDLPKYDASGEPYTYTLKEETVAGYTTEYGANNTITNTYVNTEKLVLTGKKIWNDYNNKFNTRPSEVMVTVLQNGEEFNKTIQVAGEMTTNEWAFTVEDLPKYDASGEPYTYTLKEETVAGYTTEYGANNTITNTYVNTEKINIVVTKQWNDYKNKFNTRPTEIVFNLRLNGAVIQNPSVTATDNWQFEFTNLDKYDSETGELNEYTVGEVPVAGYEDPVVTGNAASGFTVTNTYRNLETVDIFGHKTWNDANDQDRKRPTEIIVQVMNKGQKVAEKAVTESEQWAYNFTGLPKYDALGELIPYTIAEAPIAEYQSEVIGYNITNHYTPAKTQVNVTKIWNDAENQDGKRPLQVAVQLLANGIPNGRPIMLSDSNNWTYTWSNLDLNQAGKPIVYTLQELDVPAGYTSIITEPNEKQFTITNSYTPETVDITGKKTWNDAANQDGNRPNEITVNVISEGQVVETATINEAAQWMYSFTNLPKYKAGQLITYTLQEVVPTGYSATYEGNNITNNYTPTKTQVSVTKVWNDGDNQDGIRPNDVQVQLYANGQKHGQPITLNTGNNWTHTWNNLDLKQQGIDIKYTIQEVGEIAGYTSTITEPDSKQFILLNTHTPETIEVNGVKTWDDANNQDGKRPQAITVHLLANGQLFEVTTTNETNKWAYSFKNLPKNLGGKPVTYTIDEEVVAGYQKEITGYDITNRYTPEQTDLTIVKIWQDADNQDGIRPSKVKVALIADGKELEQKELSEATNWQHQWQNLPKYRNGVEIQYEAKEVSQHEGYTSTNVYDTLTRTMHITNVHTPETISVPTSVTWQDADNQDGKRPNSVEIHLLADNVKVDASTLTAKDNWQHTFINLPKYKAGKEIVYTALEVNVPAGYQATYSEDRLHITNIYNPENTTFTVLKRWDDKENADKIRPKLIKIQLYVADKAQGAVVELNADNKWTHTFTNLPKFASGEVIQYEVKEVDVPKGYAVTYQDSSPSQVTITNSHTPDQPKEESKSLPKTGEDVPIVTIAVGILFLVGAAGYFIYNKQHKR